MNTFIYSQNTCLYGDACPSPYQASDKKMILEEETFESFGYYPGALAKRSDKRILAVCETCGKFRNTTKHDYRTFCNSCVKKFAKAWKKESNPKWKGGKIKTICSYCKTPIDVRPYHFGKTKNGHFCSVSCGRKFRKNFPKHHTKPELIFEEICKTFSLPFKYNGDGSIWIGKKRALNPDFIESSGKKICVEIFGDYWHSPLLNRNMREYQTLDYRKDFFKKHGWKSIFLWESDLLRKDAKEFVLEKLKKEGAI